MPVAVEAGEYRWWCDRLHCFEGQNHLERHVEDGMLGTDAILAADAAIALADGMVEADAAADVMSDSAADVESDAAAAAVPVVAGEVPWNIVPAVAGRSLGTQHS